MTVEETKEKTTFSEKETEEKRAFIEKEDLESKQELKTENFTEEIEVKKSRQVSIAEYMFKNIHLLGFENSSRVLNVAIRELMDNSLDACNSFNILPYIKIKIIPEGKKGYKLCFLDKGPGISPSEVPNICCRLLYGNKFIDNVPQRGQQGLGLTGLILYSQKTRGKPVHIVSKTKDSKEWAYDLEINIKTNRPVVIKKKIREPEDEKAIFTKEESGFYVEIVLESSYIKKGSKASTSLLEQYCYLNPTLSLEYEGPEKSALNIERVTETIAIRGEGVKLVPHHLVIGEIQEVLKESPDSSIGALLEQKLEDPFQNLTKCLKECEIPYYLVAKYLSYHKIEELLLAFKKYYEGSKPTPTCLVDLGPSIIKTVTKNNTILFDKIINVTSDPIYYEKGVLKVEACAFYGTESISKDEKIVLYRVANGTPLIYQAPSCCITKCVIDFDWKAVGLTQVENELPKGNLVLFLHLNSTKNAFITESKDAIADLPSIRQCINSCLKKLSKEIRVYMKKEDSYKVLLQKKNIINKVVPDLLKTLEEGLKREIVSRVNLKKLKADILELVCFYHKEGITECYNGTKGHKRFKMIEKEKITQIDLAPNEKIVFETPSKLELIDLSPIEYIQFKE